MTFEEFLMYVTKNIAKNDKRKFRDVEFVKYDEKLSVLDDWTSHFDKTQKSASGAKSATAQDLSTCLLSTNVVNQIFSTNE